MRKVGTGDGKVVGKPVEVKETEKKKKVEEKPKEEK